jgi:hypothetical protein
MKINKNKGFVSVAIVLIIIAVLIIGGFIYYTNKNSDKLTENKIEENNYQPIVQENKNDVVNNPTAESKDIIKDKNQSVVNDQVAGFIPIFYIGKTKIDYSNFVWMTLSSDKTKIVEGSSPKNSFQNKYIVLHDGYVMGGFIDPLSVPLDLTIANYKQMDELSVSFTQMYNIILDKNPFVELYKCNNSASFTNDFSSNAVNIINSYIDNNQLTVNCSKII